MDQAFLEKKVDPVRQAAVFLGASAVLMALTRLFNLTGWYEVDPLFPWSIATALLLLFAVLNSLLSLNADSFVKYWGRSMYSFLGLALGNGLMAWFVSGVPIGEAQSYRWIYVVVTFGFLVILSMINLMKKIVQFAEREEWTQPRKRR